MSLEIECRVLGALIAFGNPAELEVQNAFLSLTADYFINRQSQELFNLIKKHYDAHEKFDSLVIAERIKDPNDFNFYLEIESAGYTRNLLQSDIKLLKQKYRKMAMLSLFKQGINEMNAESLVDASCNIGADIAYKICKLGTIDEKHIVYAEESANRFLSKPFSDNKVIPTGIETLDKCLNGGFRNGTLITIAGRPSMGKTGFAARISHGISNNALFKHALFFSLEMDSDEIYKKQLASIIGKHPQHFNKDEKTNAVALSQETQFTIDTKPLATIDYIETASRVMHSKKPISVIVVDYIGLVQNTNRLETHVLRQADVSLRLAALAKSLDCIVIGLTQVNRDYASRDDKCPVTSDAADSSGSERSSSYWFGIYRPELDNPDDPGLKNQFFVKCRKDRWNSPWTCFFDFNGGTFGETKQHNYYVPTTPVKGIKGFKSDRDALNSVGKFNKNESSNE